MEEFADFISIISGLMTIFGITGIVGWSLTKESKQTLSQASSSIFSKAFKLALCFLFFLLLLQALYFIHFHVRLNFINGWVTGDPSNLEFWWKSSAWWVYSLSYFVYASICLPIYIVIASCIYSWSLLPAKIFWSYLKNR